MQQAYFFTTKIHNPKVNKRRYSINIQQSFVLLESCEFKIDLNLEEQKIDSYFPPV